MGHSLMYEDKVVQAEIDRRTEMLSEKNQRINELGEQLVASKAAYERLSDLMSDEVRHSNSLQVVVQEHQNWREQVREKLGELRDKLYCTEQPEWAVDQVEKVMAELGLAKEQL